MQATQHFAPVIGNLMNNPGLTAWPEQIWRICFFLTLTDSMY
jgi:hypothetical protein